MNKKHFINYTFLYLLIGFSLIALVLFYLPESLAKTIKNFSLGLVIGVFTNWLLNKLGFKI